jgi:ABC-type multidrug transport system permease subunit
MRGRLTSYARYHLTDYLLYRAALPIALVLLFGYMTWYPTDRRLGHGFWTTRQGEAFALELYNGFMGFFLGLGAFLGIARIVTEERANGYFRFLFSKPVSLTSFYAQQWLVHGLAFSSLAALLAALIGAATTPRPVLPAFEAAALTWILIGGVGFLLGALTNVDAALLVLVWIASQLVHTLKREAPDQVWGWVRQLARVMPPTHKLDYVRDTLYAGWPMHWTNFWHVVAYGVLAFVAALLVLRRTSLSR